MPSYSGAMSDEEVALVATLKGNKGSVQSEFMTKTAAEKLLAEAVDQLNDPTGPQFIKLGTSAVVSRADVMGIEFTYPPSFGFA